MYIAEQIFASSESKLFGSKGRYLNCGFYGTDCKSRATLD